MKIINVAAVYPDFMKIGPITVGYKRNGQIEAVLVRTAQHYDYKMIVFDVMYE